GCRRNLEVRCGDSRRVVRRGSRRSASIGGITQQPPSAHSSAYLHIPRIDAKSFSKLAGCSVQCSKRRSELSRTLSLRRLDVRPHGQTKLGFFPLPIAEAKRLKNWLNFTGEFSALDTCMGDGVEFSLILRVFTVLYNGLVILDDTPV